MRLGAADVNARGIIGTPEVLSIARRTVNRNLLFASGDWHFSQNSFVVNVGDTSLSHSVSSLCFGDVNASFFPAPPARLSGEPLMPLGRLNITKGDIWEWPIYLTEGRKVGAMTLEFLLPEGLHVDDVLFSETLGDSHRDLQKNILFHQNGNLLILS